MALSTEVNRKRCPVLNFWLHWISIMSSTTNSLIGKELEVSRVRRPCHKVLVFQTIELSKSPLCAGEGESPRGTGSRPVSPRGGWVLAQVLIIPRGAAPLPTQIPPAAPLARGCNSGHPPACQILLSWKTQRMVIL